VDYYHATVPDQPGEAFRFLSALADAGVDLLAFTAVPIGVLRTQLTIFPADPAKMESHLAKLGVDLDGPYGAILVQGDDAPGALVDVHQRLYEADVNVYASTGVAGADGGYGYVIYLRPEAVDRAAAVLGI
jgi:hypothetical protein